MIKETLLNVLTDKYFLTSRQVAMLIRQQTPEVWEQLKIVRKDQRHHSTLSAMANVLKDLVESGLVVNERLWEPSMNKSYINLWKKV